MILTEDELKEIEDQAKKHARAIAHMNALGRGLGGLSESELDDVRSWEDSSENDHADTVLSLITELRLLREQLNYSIDDCAQKEDERDTLQAKLNSQRIVDGMQRADAAAEEFFPYPKRPAIDANAGQTVNLQEAFFCGAQWQAAQPIEITDEMVAKAMLAFMKVGSTSQALGVGVSFEEQIRATLKAAVGGNRA